MYSSDEREPPNQRDIGSKTRDLVTASVEPVNGARMFTVFSGCQEARRKKEEASCDLDRVIVLGCWVRWLQARGSIDVHCIWLCLHGLAGPCWFRLHAASPGATGTKTTSRGHSTLTLGLGFLPDLTKQCPFCVHWQEHIWSLGMSWLDFLLMPSHVASHAKCTSVGSLCFGQFGVCSLDHSSSPAFFGRCRRKMSAEESWRRRGVSSNVCQMSVIWYVLHVFPCIHVFFWWKGTPQPTWHRQQEAWLDDCFCWASERRTDVHSIFWLPGS